MRELHPPPRLLPGALLLTLVLSLLAATALGQEAVADPAPEPDAPLPEALAPADAEDCLACHRFRGLARLDHETGELRLFFCSDRHYARQEGPHSRLACTDCHEREPLSAVPHEDPEPVDCSRSCHLAGPGGLELEFSHEAIAEKIERSVHASEALADLVADDSPLREGQSACLFCHDEPVFREAGAADPAHRGEIITARCDSCHTEELPVDVEYFLRHTAGRLQSARPIERTAEVCAACHSDHALSDKMELHDAVTSYFHSFHGKASLLGNALTATCVDCHRTEEGDVHLMLSAEDPESRTHEANLETTCRTANCHPNAVPQLSAAGVHLSIDPDARTPEFYVMAAFVVLTVGVMTIYFLLVLLELLNAALRPHSEEHKRRVAVAEALMRTKEGGRRLLRLTVHQRWQHWALVLNFFVLVLSGMPLKFATKPGMAAIATLFGGIDGARLAHRVAGVLLILAFLYHVGYVAWHAKRDWARRREEQPERPARKRLFDLVMESPMMVTPRDLVHFGQLFLYLVGLRRDRPMHGRYHFSQKFEYWAVFWGMAIIGTSGAMLWASGWVTQVTGGRSLNFAFIVHSDEAFLALIYISVVHFFAVIFSPSVFPLNLGSLTGVMPPEELAEQHTGHLLTVAEELGLDVERAAPHNGTSLGLNLMRRGYALLLALFVATLGFFSLRMLVEELVAGHSVVEVEEIPLRLDERSLAAAEGDHEQRSLRTEQYARGPMSHYHVIPTWFRPDPGNGCSSSGCHQALPHGERKEDRAFLNMHSTFVDCLVCHLDEPMGIDDLSWVALEDRAGRPAPAVLRLAEVLRRPFPEDSTRQPDAAAELLALTTEDVADTLGDDELERWRLELETARIGGPRYLHVYGEMQRWIGLHGHGEYGAKVGLPGRVWTPDAEQAAAADALADGIDDEAERQLQVDIVHRGVVRPEVRCTRCHTENPTVVDFETLGYAQERAHELQTQAVARQSEAIEQGEVFYLPSVLDGTPGRYDSPLWQHPEDELPPEDSTP